MLTKDQILAASDPQIDSLSVPEWGGVVGFRKLSCAGAEAYQDYLISLQNGDGGLRISGMRTKLLSLVLCGDDGQLLFSEDDLAALGEKDSEVIQRLFDHAKMLNATVQDAGEELEKN